MSYSSKGNRPFEAASKSSHSYIINDEYVKAFIENCELPKSSSDIDFTQISINDVDHSVRNPIEYIIAFDGGSTTVNVKKSYPSANLTFFQFGASFFQLSDLEGISNKPFISPEDIAKLKELERIKLVLPTKNISLKEENTLVDSVRKTLYDFFMQSRGNSDSYMKTLKWFLFRQFENPIESYQLSNCPKCNTSKINIKITDIKDNYTTKCPHCKSDIHLIDVFRLHEVIDNEIGAGGVIAYLTNLIEHIIMIHTIRIILKIQPKMLQKTLFIKDGPLAFFGQTANMFKPMRDLTNFLRSKHNLYLAGLEKSGVFVEHADEISTIISDGQYLLLDNKYIYSHILPGNPETSDPYGRTAYYSSKIIYKSKSGGIYVVSLPTADENIVLQPNKSDFMNLDIILENIDRLKCDMYQNSLLPVALVNKLVSLSNHPSSVLLEKFAKQGVVKK